MNQLYGKPTGLFMVNEYNGRGFSEKTIFAYKLSSDAEV